MWRLVRQRSQQERRAEQERGYTMEQSRRESREAEVRDIQQRQCESDAKLAAQMEAAEAVEAVEAFEAAQAAQPEVRTVPVGSPVDEAGGEAREVPVGSPVEEAPEAAPADALSRQIAVHQQRIEELRNDVPQNPRWQGLGRVIAENIYRHQEQLALLLLEQQHQAARQQEMQALYAARAAPHHPLQPWEEGYGQPRDISRVCLAAVQADIRLRELRAQEEQRAETARRAEETTRLAEAMTAQYNERMAQHRETITGLQADIAAVPARHEAAREALVAETEARHRETMEALDGLHHMVAGSAPAQAAALAAQQARHRETMEALEARLRAATVALASAQAAEGEPVDEQWEPPPTWQTFDSPAPPPPPPLLIDGLSPPPPPAPVWPPWQSPSVPLAEEEAAGVNFTTSTTECCICMDSRATHLLFPCGHKCLCAGCVADPRTLSENVCPICRCEVHGVCEVFG